MPSPLLFAASALLIASFIASAFAVPAGPKRDIQYCTVDDILGPLSSYLPIQADVDQFCSTLIGITNVDTTVTTTTPISCVATSQSLAVMISDVLQYRLLHNPNNWDHYSYCYFIYGDSNRNNDVSSFRSKETERGGTCR
jgi:hypothetical protein